MLTVSTQIPTAVRGKIRALVKSHPEWRLFLEAKEIISANAKNQDLIEFALFHPTLTSQIEQILNETPADKAVAPIDKRTDKAPSQIDVDGIIAQIEALLKAQKPRIRIPYRKAA